MRPPQLIRVAGRQVAVEDAGPASGFPVVVHHGGTRHLFPGAVRDAQASGLRLISYDRPGQGMSVPQPGRVVADEDHTNIEENNRGAAIAWVRRHM